MLKRIEAEVKGHVQGVGFRAFVEQESTKWNVTGTVRNTEAGSVLIQVQGPEEEVIDFLSNVKKGNRFSGVEDMVQKEMELKEKEVRFSTIY